MFVAARCKSSASSKARQLDVVEKILRHLGLWEGPLRTLPKIPAPPKAAAMEPTGSHVSCSWCSTLSSYDRVMRPLLSSYQLSVVNNNERNGIVEVISGGITGNVVEMNSDEVKVRNVK